MQAILYRSPIQVCRVSRLMFGFGDMVRGYDVRLIIEAALVICMTC